MSFHGDALADALAVGHSPSGSLSPQDESLFRAFQSNLLSLVSHELRTPLTGVLNALGALEEGTRLVGLSTEDLIKMARENALRLQRALTTLLDLAALESGSFHLRLREVDLSRIVKTRIDSHQGAISGRQLQIDFEKPPELPAILLADPQKLGRVLDLCFQVLIPRAESQSGIKIRISSAAVEFEFELAKSMEKLWETSWSQSLMGFHGGVTSPYSAFGGIVQSEQAFLSRVEDGFGSEFLLIHEIMRLHGGRFGAHLDEQQVKLKIELPELTSEEGLQAVLRSRTMQITSELGAVALILVRVPQDREVETIREVVRSRLFRSTDAVYPLPARRELAIVLDDCKPEDAPRLMHRIRRFLRLDLTFGIAQCPVDGLDPLQLLDLAEKRLTLAEKNQPS